MKRVAFGLVIACVALLLAIHDVAAHTRSQSFSTWTLRRGELVVVFSANEIEATRLAQGGADAGDLAELLRAHVAARITAERAGRACTTSASATVLASRSGTLRAELRFACPESGALRLGMSAFVESVPAHVHYARVQIDARPPFELLFTEAHRRHEIDTARDDGAGHASFVGYVGIGIEHILAGTDHIAFLLALLLLCRRLRDVSFLVTGFTLGHSVTLALATLGVARPNAPVVESLIGFTIALVAAENVAVRVRGDRSALATFSALGLVALAGVHATTLVGLPVATSLGLAVFVLAYLPLASDPVDAIRIRPWITVVFGLVHGFGFANVLMEIGLPTDRLVSALLGFNVGVEIGQLALVAGLGGIGTLLARRIVRDDLRRLAFGALSAALCGIGLFWFVGRALAR